MATNRSKRAQGKNVAASQAASMKEHAKYASVLGFLDSTMQKLNSKPSFGPAHLNKIVSLLEELLKRAKDLQDANVATD